MSHKNNFDFFRLLFALIVVVAHSYRLSDMSHCGWFCQAIIDHDISLSYIAMRCLFVMSGYLIFQSLMSSEGLADYFWKRCLRLFPALYVVLLLTVMLAPFVYDGTVMEYINNPTAWTYLPNNFFLINLQYSINGVFENNTYKSAINGSLWTIPYEFFFYIVLCPLYIFRKRSTILKYILLLIFTYLFVGIIFFKEAVGSYQFILNGWYILDLGIFFTAGSLLAAFKIERSSYLNWILMAAFTLLITSLAFSFFSIFQYFAIPLIIIPLGLTSTKHLNTIRKSFGDLSYGIYIYGFPVQQVLMHYFNFNYLELMVSSIIITFVLAYASWHLVEKRALSLKKLYPGSLFSLKKSREKISSYKV